MKVEKSNDRYVVLATNPDPNREYMYTEKGQPFEAFAIVYDYTLLDSNKEFLEKLKKMAGQLGSLTIVKEIQKEGKYYKLMFTTSVCKETVRKNICEVYTEYLSSSKPLIYPFAEQYVDTPNPKNISRVQTTHLQSLLNPIQTITDQASGQSLVLLPTTNSLQAHPLKNVISKLALSGRFFKQVADGTIKEYQEETQARYDGQYLVYKKNHRGYQFNQEGDISEYNSEDEGLSL